EYKAYFQDRWEHRKLDRGQTGTPSPGSEAPSPGPKQPVPPPSQPQALPPPMPRGQVEIRKPLVYHADNLPRELPSWFAELDTNHDAQVGLYEWKVSGRSIEEFQRMDRNNDGFLTVEEVLAYQAKMAGRNPGSPGNGSRPLSRSRTLGN